jgi:PAS domain S-box-containing protein
VRTFSQTLNLWINNFWVSTLTRPLPKAASIVRTLLLAFAGVAASALIRMALNPLFGTRVAFIMFFPAVVFSAWVGGWLGGLTALFLSTLAAVYFFINPSHSLLIANHTDQLTLVVFVVVGFSISAISSAQHKAHRDAAGAVEEAEHSLAALRESETRKSAILEVALDCIITIDADGNIVDFNPAAEATFGFQATDVIGHPVAETIIPPSLRGAHHAGFAQYLATGAGPILGQRIEVVGMRSSGEEFPVEIAIVPMQRSGAPFFTAYLRDISGRKALEIEQLRLADANRLLLDSTGEGIYGIDTAGCFTFVNQAAAQMLGYSVAEMIGQSGHRMIHGRRPDGSIYPEEECPIYRAIHSGQSIQVEDEVFWRKDGTAFPAFYSAAPIIRETSLQGAVVTFSDISERKALEKERERLLEREHHIAEQLQEALQPAIPRQVPGLELADYYRPALEEAGVGGDFLDVFAADKGVTFLVAGDLSGKGLAAASQVSIVRNMLRFALYNGRTLNGPVTTLSRTLVGNDLLTGFATLFVGRYAAAERELNYVNCGQDAALVLRSATGQVESLPPTGPVLGAFPEAEYAEETVRLEPGDVLAIFTDGLTEAGPSRMALLTGDGVATLLRESPSLRSATEIVSHLISGVDAHAQGGTRDDQCLLVGIVS